MTAEQTTNTVNYYKTILGVEFLIDEEVLTKTEGQDLIKYLQDKLKPASQL